MCIGIGVHYNATNNIFIALALHLCKVVFVDGQIIFHLSVELGRLIIFNFIFIWETGRIENFLFFEWVLPFHPLFDYSRIWNSSGCTEV